MPSRRHSRHAGPVYLAIQFTASLGTLHFQLCTSVTGTVPLNPASLRRTAAVVRDRRDVADRLHFDADRLQRPDRRLAARAGTGHAHFHRPQAHGLGSVARVDGRLRGGERRALARSLEPDGARARPGDHVALGVGDRHDRVVERRLDVRQAGVHDALLAPLLERLLLLARGLFCAGCRRFSLRHGLHRLLLGNRALARALAGARVRARPLAAHRQAAAVPQAAVAADFHQALDVERDLLAEIAFHTPLLLDHPADLADVVFRQVLHADVRAHARFLEDQVRPVAADAVDVGQPDLDPLGAREVHACDTRHFVESSSGFRLQTTDFRRVCGLWSVACSLSLPLSLLVLLVRADHPDHALAANDLALVTNALDGRSYLHRLFPRCISGRTKVRPYVPGPTASPAELKFGLTYPALGTTTTTSRRSGRGSNPPASASAAPGRPPAPGRNCASGPR